MEKVANLNREVKRLLFDLRRADTRFSKLCQTSWKLEMLMDVKSETGFATPVSGSSTKRFYNRFILLWTLKVQKPMMKYIGYLFALMSMILLCAELSIFTKAPINVFKVFVSLDTGYYST